MGEMMRKPTIYEVLKAQLQREPTHRELCDEVKRILSDAWLERQQRKGRK